MNKNSVSKLNAARIILFIKRSPCSTTADICNSLEVTKYQFQAALPYVKPECKRIKLEWYLK